MFRVLVFRRSGIPAFHVLIRATRNRMITYTYSHSVFFTYSRQNSKLSKISIIARLRPLWRDEDAEMSPFYIYLFQKIASNQTIVTWYLFWNQVHSSASKVHTTVPSAHNTLQIHLHIFVSSTQLSWVIHSTDLVMYFEKVRRKSVAIKWGLYQWNMKRSTFAWLVFLCLLLQCYFLFLVQQQSTHVRHELIPERKTKIRGEFYHFLESVSQVFKENIEVKR